MLKYLKQLAGDSMIYGISGIVGKMIGIFLVPLYTRLFLPEDYGVINLINTSFFLLGILVVCALDNSVYRWFFDTIEESDRKKSFGSYIWFQVILAIFVSALIIIFSPCPCEKLFSKTGKAIYLILPALSSDHQYTYHAVLINW